ncbi:alpha,alpha-trehalose-phosphate synthase [UDP-forming] 5, partial [Olea europaea subsp. europaea]
GVNKGLVAVRFLATMRQKEVLPDFVLCIGIIDQMRIFAEVFACTVGQKPSKAKYYLEDTLEILRMLQDLADASEQSAKNVTQSP